MSWDGINNTIFLRLKINSLYRKAFRWLTLTQSLMNLDMFWGHNGGTWPYDGITFVPGHMVTFARQNHFQCTIGGHGASPWKSWASEWTHREILNNNDLTCSSYLFIILTCSNEDKIHFFFGKRFPLGSLFIGHFSEKYLENIKHVWWMNEEQSCKVRSNKTLFP